MIRLRRFGAPSFLKMATTAMGSVAAMSAPNTRACFQVKFLTNASKLAAGVRTRVVTAMAATTPGTAREIMVSRRSAGESRAGFQSQGKAHYRLNNQSGA